MTLQPMMMHHNTEFGSKMFGGLENIWKNIDILTLHCDLDLEDSKPIFKNKNNLVHNNASPNQLW